LSTLICIINKMRKTFIIAEAGVNHNGSVDLAKKLIDVAVDSECDAVKFQTFKAESLVSKHAKKAKYQEKTTGVEESHFQMIKNLELSYNDFIELKKYCDYKKIMFLSTPFDIDIVDFLNFSEIKRRNRYWNHKSVSELVKHNK